MHGRKPGPNRLHVFDTGGAGIMQFAAKNEKGLAVDNKLGCAAVILKMGQTGWGAVSLSEG